ncbi:TonB-dependent receptor domain-containing protein [Phocaeicola plebeius]|uniref:TonB-dependent receptor domain-containing protein n=1 Tax=Phocaeicola plebeius TaxID=310297 RepID=UPI0026F28B45|nr:TonB-dependent receptor [Phocaeicola plebeius]
MRYFVVFLIYISCNLACIAQSITGKIVDEQGNAIQFANVAMLQSKDSVFVKGVVSDENGSFILNTPHQNGIVKVTCIGYRTVFLNVTDDNLGVIVLKEESMTLGDVIVKSSLPKSKLKNGAVITTVAGSILEKTGNIYNLLDRIPNVTTQNGKINIFGIGEPVIYINGKKVRDNTELDRLNPDEISTVEVKQNPGAQYASNVKAVIRINTKKRTKDGFGFETRTFGKNDENSRIGGYEQLNINYQKKGLETFTVLKIKDAESSIKQDLVQNTYVDNVWHQRNDIKGSIRNRQLYCGLGVNYQISNNSFIGASFNFNRMFNKAVSNIATTIYKDYAFTEESASDIAKPGNMSLASSNVYYMGKIGIVDINFNTDWLWDKDFSKVNTLERYQEYGGDWQDKAVHTKTNTKNELFASKLTLTLPFWKGQLSFGGEYSNTNRNSSYDVQPMGLLDKQDNRIKEGMASVFCDYTRKFGQLGVLAGIRYENTDFNYYEEGKRIPEQSKRYGNLLPSLSLSLPVGKTQMQLSYGATIKRPSYYDMRSGIGYDNRYTYESGNPFLVSEISRNINYMVSYKWLMAEGIYTHVSDPIVMLTQSYKDNPNIALIQNVNWKPYNRIGASLSASPKFGIWHPSLRFHFFKQWFDMETHGGHGLDNPKITVRFDNTIDTKFCTISLLLTAQTKGDDETSYMYRNYFSSNLSIYKSFLKGKMVVFFYANDLLGTGNMHSKMYSGSMREIIHHDYSISEYSLTIRYRFNVAKKKYKGTGAGQSQKSRMSL